MKKKEKKDTLYFKKLKKVREQTVPNAMIPRTVSLVQDQEAKLFYLVDWKDRKFTSVKSTDLPKDSEWDWDKKHWTKMAA